VLLYERKPRLVVNGVDLSSLHALQTESPLSFDAPEYTATSIQPGRALSGDFMASESRRSERRGI